MARRPYAFDVPEAGGGPECRLVRQPSTRELVDRGGSVASAPSSSTRRATARLRASTGIVKLVGTLQSVEDSTRRRCCAEDSGTLRPSLFSAVPREPTQFGRIVREHDALLTLGAEARFVYLCDEFLRLAVADLARL